MLGFVALCLLSYGLAIKGTIAAKREHTENLAKRAAVADLPHELAALGQRERQLDALLGELDLEDTSMQSNLLKFLNAQAATNGVKVIDFNAPHTVPNANGRVETYIFHLEGGYDQILRTIHFLENKGGFGAVVHVGLEKKRDYRTKRTYLQAEVFLKQVR